MTHLFDLPNAVTNREPYELPNHEREALLDVTGLLYEADGNTGMLVDETVPHPVMY